MLTSHETNDHGHLLCFTGGMKQNQNHDLNLVEEYFKRYWLPELHPATELVKQMLSFAAGNRPREISPKLKTMFPDVIKSFTDWLDTKLCHAKSGVNEASTSHQRGMYNPIL